MKTITLAFSVSFALSAVLAQAEELPATTENARRSVNQGFISPSSRSLSRQAPRSADRTAKLVLARICKEGCLDLVQATTHGVLAENPKLVLFVSPDGTYGDFTDKEAMAQAAALAKPVGNPMSGAAMEALARAYLSKNLSEVITLGPNERMVPLRTLNKFAGQWNNRTRKSARVVLSNEIVFGRAIDGMLVVGGGSTIRLSFGHDGRLLNFGFDWPTYAVAGSQPVPHVSTQEGLTRLGRVLGARSGNSLPMSALAKAYQASYLPVPLGEVGELHDYQCGFFDPGRSSAQVGGRVEAACAYHVLLGNQAVAGAVPMTGSIAFHVDWPEARALLGLPVANPANQPETQP